MRNWSVLLGIALTACIVALAWYWPFDSDRGFVAHPLPLQSADRLFDIGVVDADGDGHMDVYTSNHHFRQVLWLGDGKGGFRDVLGVWRLDQSRDFPLAELAFAAPIRSKPGVYVYWLGTQFVIQTHRGADLGSWRGTLRVLDPVRIASSEGFEIQKTEIRAGQREGAELTFSAAGDGRLMLVPGGQGLPLEFRFEGGLRPDQIFVGLGKVSPSATSFALAMRDRHAHAWADINDDGVLDVFISRGALGGRLLELPPAVRDGLRDELLVTHGVGAFSDVTVEAGIEKRGCSARHASWVDVDGDGSLELFVNCYDREAVAGDYPKQLYRRVGPMRFEDVAQALGLGLPDQQIGSYAWLDVDSDGDVDLLAYQDEGVFLYRQAKGTFTRELVCSLPELAAQRIGGSAKTDWYYDGKVSVGDVDGDGDFDALVTSKRGLLLLRNDNGRLVPEDAVKLGLPSNSVTGALVDFDNDGRLDIHLIPQGLYRQREDGRFERTDLLAFEPDQFLAAIVNWLDFDEDGRVDVLMALDPNPQYKPPAGQSEGITKHGRWQLVAYRNTNAAPGWLAVDLHGASGNREGIGAVVSVTTDTGTQSKLVGSADGAFFSQGHYRVHFGLGAHSSVDSIRVKWPDGVVQALPAAEAGRVLKISRP